MNNLRDLMDEANQSESADLLTVPGAATIKACSILINSFFRHPVLTETSRRQSVRNDLINDITFLNNSISVTEPLQPDIQTSITRDEAQPEIPVTSKAHEMVHHLRHTHSKNNIAN
jgi:hypothetical protein